MKVKQSRLMKKEKSQRIKKLMFKHQLKIKRKFQIQVHSYKLKKILKHNKMKQLYNLFLNNKS